VLGSTEDGHYLAGLFERALRLPSKGYWAYRSAVFAVVIVSSAGSVVLSTIRFQNTSNKKKIVQEENVPELNVSIVGIQD